jgi:hypothetical protein
MGAFPPAGATFSVPAWCSNFNTLGKQNEQF